MHSWTASAFSDRNNWRHCRDLHAAHTGGHTSGYTAGRPSACGGCRARPRAARSSRTSAELLGIEERRCRPVRGGRGGHRGGRGGYRGGRGGGAAGAAKSLLEAPMLESDAMTHHACVSHDVTTTPPLPMVCPQTVAAASGLTLVTHARLNGVPCAALVDTGAEVSFVNGKWLESHGLPTRVSAPLTVTVANNTLAQLLVRSDCPCVLVGDTPT
jgi:hypothetical protein